MDASIYQPLFLFGITLLCVIAAGDCFASPDGTLQGRLRGFAFPLTVCLVLVFWIGLRPINGTHFGDTINYALQYRNLHIEDVSMNWHYEWIWQWLMMSCKAAGLSVGAFFTIVEAGYVLTALWAVKRFMPSSPTLGMLFVWASLMYFSFGVNGLRNGLACHIVLLAISFLLDSKYVQGVALCLVALGIHRSTLLPIAAITAAFFMVRKPQLAIYFWIASIAVSLVAGGTVTTFFASLGFDDRMVRYAIATSDLSGFSQIGFRWDFLIYSAIPVLMFWYVAVHKGITDLWYNAIGITYCLSNAFWVMVIRSSFSNRFAYLSWFIYPLVIAYPLVNLTIWDSQSRKTGYILLAYCGFTVFMQLIYW